MSEGLEQERHQPAYVQKRQQTKDFEGEYQRHAEKLAAINSIADQLAIDQSQQGSADNKRALRERVTIGLLIATVFFTALGDGIFYETMKDAREAASRAHDDNTKAMKQAAQANRDTSRDAEQTRIESSRAWIGPTTAAIDAVPVAGQPIIASISYQNTGKEPARNFRWFANPITRTVSDDLKGRLVPEFMEYMNKCLRTPDTPNAGVVYPNTGFGGNTMTVTIAGNNIDQSVITGPKLAIVQGCFVYRTFNQTHHSAFCLFWNGKPVAKAGEAVKPANLNMNNCIVGNNAD